MQEITVMRTSKLAARLWDMTARLAAAVEMLAEVPQDDLPRASEVLEHLESAEADIREALELVCNSMPEPLENE